MNEDPRVTPPTGDQRANGPRPRQQASKKPGIPAYQDLARELRTAISDGQYSEEDQLPTEEELVNRLGLSRHTVRRAYQVLVAEGTVYRVPGRGTFPNRQDRQYLHHFGSIEELMGLSRETSMELLNPLRRRVEVGAAGRLRSESDVIITLRFRRIHDADVFCVTDVYLPVTLAPVLQDIAELNSPGMLSRATVIGILDSHLDSPITQAEQSVSAVEASDELSQLLECEPGDPLLRIDRLYLDDRGTPVELAISHFLPRLYSYRLKLKRRPG